MFQGSGENALQSLEGLVTKHLVTKQHLTLMQLQRAVQGISCLDSPCQLAAIGVLVTAGYWLAAMQVMREDRRSSYQPNAMTAKLPDAEAADTMPGNVACTFTAARSLWTLLDMYWAGGQVVVVGFCTSVELTSCLCPCLWIMPYEPSLARALVAHERAVRRGPDPV
mgnify:CR=1 FL=1